MINAHWNDREVTGDHVERDGATWYRIRNVDRMPPFLTSLASASDHWLFLSSRGPLTAGRRNIKSALFPYTTDDRMHDAVDQIGGKTIVHIEGQPRPWEPASPRDDGIRDVSSDLWRDLTGAAFRTEDHEHSLGLTRAVTWTTGEEFGLVRRVEIRNDGSQPVKLRVLDGLLHLLPADVDPSMQAGLSNLVDAYKDARLRGENGLAIYALSSIPIDRPEPNEGLRASTVWCTEDVATKRLLSEQQIEAFRRGQPCEPESTSRGRRCSYLIEKALELAPGESATWAFACEVDQDASAVRDRDAWLASGVDRIESLEADARANRARLIELIAAADGQQATGDPAADARHWSNVLYNSMRGGLFPGGHEQERSDFLGYLQAAAPAVAARHGSAIGSWPERGNVQTFRELAESTGDPDLIRLHRDYLPLAFSRRHGDPSRPWNAFSIETRSPDGSLRTWYEGNWRDIFQNWEALACSYPEYGIAFVSRFLNASTADGYNPYRITRNGVDWEVHDPDDPWSFIGYWGDHQIVYLTRLLERCEERTPGRLGALLEARQFVSVDVPYRIRGLQDLLANPWDTVTFDDAAAAAIDARVAEHGGEASLVLDGDAPRRFSLAEKLLVPFLVKLTNFVPGAGVWMNTQRPEWNDANNALVGRGASIVTTAALWRHARVLRDLIGDRKLLLSGPVSELLQGLRNTLESHDVATSTSADRRRFVEAVGALGQAHRTAVYSKQFGEATETSGIPAFLELAAEWLAETLNSNRRDDQLFHAYNLLTFDPNGLGIRRLPLMLEGQAAVLGSGFLEAEAAVALLDALPNSDLFCPRRNSYTLYPDRELESFVDRNVLTEAILDAHPQAAALFQRLLDGGDVVVTDHDGTMRFAAAIRNAAVLAQRLGDAPPEEKAAALAAFEAVFDHASFTGRACTFYGYEGLGSIYWHMVSKLVLAVQETWQRAVGTPHAECLRQAYLQLRAGLGAHARPDAWGAFPTDAYSHTPRDGGARQPGMTGQVKEDVLSRFGELGVHVADGQVHFNTGMLDGDGPITISLCGTPIHIERGSQDRITVRWSDGSESTEDSRSLPSKASLALFARRGELDSIRVELA